MNEKEKIENYQVPMYRLVLEKPQAKLLVEKRTDLTSAPVKEEKKISKIYLEENPLSQSINPSSFLISLLFLLLFSSFSLFSWTSSSDYLIASARLVFSDGQYLRLLTSLFVHADFLHLLSNSLLFIVFATLLHSYFGSFAFPLLSLLGGVLTNMIALLTYPENTRLLGASGMIFLMAGLWLGLFLKNSSYLKISHRFMRFLAFFLIVLVPTTFSPEVSYRSHYIGLFLGFLLSFISMPWLSPLPFSSTEKQKRDEILEKRKIFFETEDETLTELALRPHPYSLKDDSLNKDLRK